MFNKKSMNTLVVDMSSAFFKQAFTDMSCLRSSNTLSSARLAPVFSVDLVVENTMIFRRIRCKPFQADWAQESVV